MAGALKNVTVLDFSRHAPGSYCSMILGDLGADVIKIDQVSTTQKDTRKKKDGDAFPGGLVIKEFPPPGSLFDPLNRNKRSIGLNLKKDEGKEVIYKLVESADVVLEAFRPGVMERLGIHYDQLKEINPAIIYCSVSGYGQNGPYKNLVGHDLNYISQGGILGFLDRGCIPGNLIGDLAGGGMQAAIGILAAIVSRGSTGIGQYIDISMTDSVVALTSLYLGGYFKDGRLPEKHDRVSLGTTPFYSIYTAKDGKRLSFACSEPQFYANLCKLLGCEEFIEHQHNPEKNEEIKAFFSKTMLKRTRDEWFDLMSRSDIAVAKVLEPEEVVEDPQLQHRNMIVEWNHPEHGKIRQIGIAIKMSETPGSIRKFSPRSGEDTLEILKSLAYSTDTINKLSDNGVISKIESDL